MRDIRIAAAIFHSPLDEIEKSLDRMDLRVKSARQQGVRLLCFPEMNITGYSTRDNARLTARPFSREITERISRMAAEGEMVILAGMMEKNADGRLFVSHGVFAPSGISGIYRKLHISPPEKSLFSPGEEIPLFGIKGLTFGIQLCYDAHFPELSTHMALNGADIIFIPHASPRGTPQKKYRSWLRHLKARAYDNSIFIVAVNQVGDNGNGLIFPGIALVISPSGEVMDQKLCEKEDMLVVDLKEDLLTRVRSSSMHFFLPNRRQDIPGLATRLYRADHFS